MPSSPRRTVVSQGEVGVYHCWNRCVQRAWLCGQHPVTGIDYEASTLELPDMELPDTLLFSALLFCLGIARLGSSAYISAGSWPRP